MQEIFRVNEYKPKIDLHGICFYIGDIMFDNIQFIFFTTLTGFIVGFVATYLGLKISKFLLIIGAILLLIFYVFVNGNFQFDWNNMLESFVAENDIFGYGISSIRNLLMRNVPLTVGVIIGIYYGFKKA